MHINFLRNNNTIIKTLFVIIFFFYSIFSSNLPKKILLPEYCMLALFFILLIFFTKQFYKHFFLNLNIAYLLIFFVFISAYGFLIGYFNGNYLGNSLRDFVAMISLSSFFFFYYYIDNKKLIFFFFKILVYTGLIFAVKSLLDRYQFFFDLKMMNYLFNVNYQWLQIEVTILLSSYYFFFKILKNIQKLKYISIFKYIFLFSLILFLLFSHSMRGSIFFLVIIISIMIGKIIYDTKSYFFLFVGFFTLVSPIILFTYFLSKYLYSKSFFIILFLVCYLLYYFFYIDFISTNFDPILALKDKILKIGLNNRELEWIHAYNVFLENKNILYGFGFGAIIQNPINKSDVLFLHNFLLYNFYKFGVIGIFMSIIIYYYFVKCLIKSFFIKIKKVDENQQMIFYSCASALIYPLFFGANFKSITFGLVLSIYFLVYFCNLKKSI